jgi:hypothetical protein
MNRTSTLFANAEKTILRDGVSTQDINVIANTLPPGAPPEARQDIQRAYQLLYAKNMAELDRKKYANINNYNQYNNRTSYYTPPSSMSGMPSMVDQQMPQTEEVSPAEAQFMELYNKYIEEPSGDDKVKELEDLIEAKNKEIEELKNEKSTLISQICDVQTLEEDNSSSSFRNLTRTSGASLDDVLRRQDSLEQQMNNMKKLIETFLS